MTKLIKFSTHPKLTNRVLLCIPPDTPLLHNLLLSQLVAPVSGWPNLSLNSVKVQQSFKFMPRPNINKELSHGSLAQLRGCIPPTIGPA